MDLNASEGPLRIGETFLDKYEIRALIGRGGYAHVYHGHYAWGRRDVAIKIIHRDGGLTPEMVYRGQTEAQVLMNDLKHPNIVEVSDAGIHRGALYIIMELLTGNPLRDVLIALGRLCAAQTLEIFIQIAGAMALAHKKGIIHRDLKPENIFITSGNHVKALDFGIAKIVGPDAWQTQKHLVVGTSLYFSPEQVVGDGPSPQSDIYALGLMLFEALLGRHLLLLENRSRDPRVLAWFHVNYKAPRLDELDPTIPGDVAGVVQQMVAKNPKQRFQTMGEVAAALRECLGRELERLAQLGKEPVRLELWHPKAQLARLAQLATVAAPLAAQFPARAVVPDTEPSPAPSFSSGTARRTLPGIVGTPIQVVPAPSEPIQQARTARVPASTAPKQESATVRATPLTGARAPERPPTSVELAAPGQPAAQREQAASPAITRRTDANHGTSAPDVRRPAQQKASSPPRASAERAQPASPSANLANSGTPSPITGPPSADFASPPSLWSISTFRRAVFAGAAVGVAIIVGAAAARLVRVGTEVTSNGAGAALDTPLAAPPAEDVAPAGQVQAPTPPAPPAPVVQSAPTVVPSAPMDEPAARATVEPGKQADAAGQAEPAGHAETTAQREPVVRAAPTARAPQPVSAPRASAKPAKPKDPAVERMERNLRLLDGELERERANTGR